MLKLFSNENIEIIKKAPTFYTNWCIVIFFILKILSYYLNIPNYIFSTYKILIFTNSLIGNYITIKYIRNLKKLYPNISELTIHIVNFIIHIVPLILIYLSKNNKIKQNNILPSFIIILIQSLIYLYLNNPEDVYKFSGWTYSKLVSVYLVTLIICFYVYQCISK